MGALQCRVVCKKFLEIMSTPYFVSMHLKNLAKPKLVVDCKSYDDDTTNQYTYDMDKVFRSINEQVKDNNRPTTGSSTTKFDVQQQKLAVKDVEIHSDDPQMCVTYADDIYEYLHSMEVQGKRRPMPDYIEKIQKDVTADMRGVLVDWLVEVADEYELRSDTLYLTVSYLDRYLSLKALNRHELQLLGVSCMFIASKYEEISHPYVEDFCWITDDTYTTQEVVEMEADILKLLNYEMGNPTVKTFLRSFTRTAQGDCQSPNLQLEFLGCYLAELSLLDYACISFLPSMVAASVIFLTNFTIQPKKHPWNLTLQKQSNYKPSDLKHCVSTIHDLRLNTEGSSLVSIHNKYTQHKFKCVAMLTSPSEIPTEYFEDVKL